MKKLTTLLFALIFMFTLTACGEIANTPVNSSTHSSENNDTSIIDDTQNQEQDTNEAIFDEPEFLDLENDYIYLNITMEEADELFGEPLAIREKTEESGDKTGYDKIYEYVECSFSINEYDELYLSHIGIHSPEFAPVRGIKVGDSLESVREKIPLGEYDYIKYEGMYKYYLTENFIRSNDINSTYTGASMVINSYNNNDDNSDKAKGTMAIYFDENDKVYSIGIVCYYK